MKYPAGTVTAYWNGLNDNGTPMANGNYTIKLLSNNVTVRLGWSDEHLQPAGWPQYPGQLPADPVDGRSSATRLTTTPGYNEGRYQLYKFSLSNLNQTTGYGIGPHGH